MKKIILGIVILLSYLNAEGNNLIINEHKIDLYFANGMKSNLIKSTKRWKIIKNQLILKYPKLEKKLLNFEYKKYIENKKIIYKKDIFKKEKPHIAYNQPISEMLDFLELVQQKINLNEFDKDTLDMLISDESISVIKTILSDANLTLDANNTLDLPDDIRANILEYIEKEKLKSSEKLTYALKEIKNYDLKVQIDNYKKSIDAGNYRNV